MDNPRTWRPYPRNYKTTPHTLDSPDATPVEGETIPKRNGATANELLTVPEQGVATIYDIVRVSAQKYGNAKAVGYRKIVKTHDEVKKIKKMVDGKEVEQDKKWTYFELSEYHYYSYAEYERMTLQLGAGLRKLGLQPKDRLHLFGSTRLGALIK